MGTRSLTAVRSRGTTYAQYLQFDGHLNSKGKDFLEFAMGLAASLESVPQGIRSDIAEHLALAHLDLIGLATGHSFRSWGDPFGNQDSRSKAPSGVGEFDHWGNAWIEYTRVLDLDRGMVEFYKDTAIKLFKFSIPDLALLEREIGTWRVLPQMDYLQDQLTEDGTLPFTLSVEKGSRVPRELHWAKTQADTRDYVMILRDGKAIVASTFAPRARYAEAEAWAKSQQPKAQEEVGV